MDPAPDLRGPATREDTKPLMNAFANIAEKFGLSTDEQLALLGHPARSTYFKWKKEGGVLPRDTQERISYVLGIYKALQILLSDTESADSWIRRPNTAPLFDGRSALELMTQGSLVDLYRVRSYLDAQRGGWG
jgi:uncharacterized protein (DUF2384 family)